MAHVNYKGIVIENGKKFMAKWAKNQARLSSSEQEWTRAKLKMMVK